VKQPTVIRRPSANGSALEAKRRRQSRWVLWALAFPLLFLIVVSIGVYLMIHRRMEFFRPGHESSAISLKIERTSLSQAFEPLWGKGHR